jgi:hypothetical protein
VVNDDAARAASVRSRRTAHRSRAMTTWDVLTGSASVPPGALDELAALRAALPGYDVTISHSRTHRFEAIRRHTGPGPWCLISSDPSPLRVGARGADGRTDDHRK